MTFIEIEATAWTTFSILQFFIHASLGILLKGLYFYHCFLPINLAFIDMCLYNIWY